MRLFWTLLIIYLAFLIQTAVTRFPPDLVILLLLIFALYESKSIVIILSLFAGFCLDMVNPQIFGFNLMICLLAGFGVNALQEYIYYGSRYLIILLALVLFLKYLLILLLFKTYLPISEVIISGLITLVLVIPLHRLIQRFLPGQWKPA
jgi:cell shape-determining protein MreD